MSASDSPPVEPPAGGVAEASETGRCSNDCPAPAVAGRALVFELIPQVMHHKCVRAVLPNDIWRLLRKMTIDASGEQCEECGTRERLECHEVWQYLPPLDADGQPERHIMRLVGLRALCHLCHLGKHIGYAQRSPRQYWQVKQHLMNLYRLPEPIFSQLEELAFDQVGELNKAGVRALDLTHLNMDTYVWIRHRFGRAFTDDETSSCRHLSGTADLAG